MASRASLPCPATALRFACVQTPTDLANAGGHGTHVSGVALGGFPHKLVDADGQPLPYQRGVAYGAKLGAIRVSNAVDAEAAAVALATARVMPATAYSSSSGNSSSLSLSHKAMPTYMSQCLESSGGKRYGSNSICQQQQFGRRATGTHLSAPLQMTAQLMRACLVLSCKQPANTQKCQQLVSCADAFNQKQAIDLHPKVT